MTVWGVGEEPGDDAGPLIWNRFQPHAESVSCLALHGRLIATCSEDATMCLALFGSKGGGPKEAVEELMDVELANRIAWESEGFRLDPAAWRARRIS